MTVALDPANIRQVAEALHKSGVVCSPLQLPWQQPALCLAGIGLQQDMHI